MFAWFRKWWWDGEIPPQPDDDELDWPDEEEWVFNFNEWRWEICPIPFVELVEDVECCDDH